MSWIYSATEYWVIRCKGIQKWAKKSRGPDTLLPLKAPFGGKNAAVIKVHVSGGSCVAPAVRLAPEVHGCSSGTSVFGQGSSTSQQNNCKALWVNTLNENVVNLGRRECDRFPVANLACCDSLTIWTMSHVLKGRWRTFACSSLFLSLPLTNAIL